MSPATFEEYRATYDVVPGTEEDLILRERLLLPGDPAFGPDSAP